MITNVSLPEITPLRSFEKSSDGASDSPKSFAEVLAQPKPETLANTPAKNLAKTQLKPQTKIVGTDTIDEASPSLSDESEAESLSPTSQFSDKKSLPAAVKPISIHKGESKTDDQDVEENPAAGPISAWMAAHGFNITMLKAFKQEQSQEKHVLISDFVGQMQKQFGISPEQVVKAFQKMEQKDLQLPPEQTAQKFLNNLSLKPEQKPQAALLYKNLLQKTEAITVNEKLVDQIVKLQKREQKQSLLAVAAGLEPKGLEAPSPEVAEIQSAKENPIAKVEELKSAQISPPLVAMVMTDPDDQLQAEIKPGQDNRSQTKATVSPLFQTTSDQAQAQTQISAQAATQAQTQVQNQAAALAKASQPPQAQTNLRGQADSAESLAALMPALAALTNRFSQNGQQDSSSQKENSGKREGAASSLFNSSLSQQAKNQAVSSADSKAFSALMQNQAAPGTTAAAMGAGLVAAPLSAQDRADNLNEIISKAQLITKNGGGEMKVELKGAEMGPMNLKVSVEKGQVSIQMVTQSEKTRKLVEDNLQDLKTSLSAHKLHVGDLKVDLADGFQKQMDGQNPHQGREQSREAAAQFLSNMHDERESNRQGFFDSSGWRPYRRDPGERETLTPAAAAKSRASLQAQQRNMGSSRRLNLVA